MEAAKKEGAVTCYCWDFRLNRMVDWAKGFKATYGIEVEVMAFSGTIAVERMKTEARAGKYIADVFNAVPLYHVGDMEATGLLKRIDNLPTLKDAKDPDQWFVNPIITPYTMQMAIGGRFPGTNYRYNSNIVPADRLPKNFRDLLDPWWKGKICQIDPLTFAGTDQQLWDFFSAAFNYADSWPEFFWEYYNKGDRFRVYLMGSPEPLNSGECGILPGWGGANAGDIKGIHVDQKATWINGGSFDPSLPMGVSGPGVSVPAKSAHPNAALLFANWFQSKEPLQAYAKMGYGGTLRRDVLHQVEEKYWPKVPVTHYYTLDAKWVAFEAYSYARKDGVFKLIREGMPRETWLKWMKDTATLFWGQYPPPPIPVYRYD